MATSDVLILGGGQTDFAENWSRKGGGLPAVLKAGVEAALEDTGLGFKDLAGPASAGRVGAYVGNFAAPKFVNQGHLGAFLTEVDPVFAGVPAARYEAACASGSVALHAASTAIRAGDVDLAVVAGVEIMKNVNPADANDYLGLAAFYDREAKDVPFVFPRIFGRITDLLIEANGDEAGLLESLDQIALLNYANGKRNPRGQLRDEETTPARLAKLNKRFAASLGDRTRYSDSSQITDGAAVVILAGEDFAREYLSRSERTQKDLARIAGWGHRTAPLSFATKFEPDAKGPARPVHPSEGIQWTHQTLKDAYRRAGVDATGIDVFETHDCFTISEYLALSAFGICEPGQERAAIENGDIAPGGRAPVNPSGGLIGSGHPVGATGIRMVLDLAGQVTDRAGDMQIDGARRGATLNIGGSFTTNFSFVVANAEDA